MNEAELGLLAGQVVKLLTEQHKSLSVAESCTGGWLSKIITDVSGASAVFPGGICTYSNEMKEKFIGVSHETLSAHGAVSEETAREMASGVKKAFCTDIGVGITGIAGPLSDNTEKPIGLIYIAVCGEHGINVTELKNSFIENVRENNRYSAVKTALTMIGNCL